MSVLSTKKKRVRVTIAPEPLHSLRGARHPSPHHACKAQTGRG
jgi:hypothetical protein